MSYSDFDKGLLTIVFVIGSSRVSAPVYLYAS